MSDRNGEISLVDKRRSPGELKCYALMFPGDTSLTQLAPTIKGESVYGQDRRQLKEELGFNHYDGRSRIGLHCYALIIMIA